MRQWQIFCLIIAMGYCWGVKYDVFTQNKYRVKFDRATVKSHSPDYFYNVQLKNVMVNRTERAFNLFFCLKERLYGNAFKLNIKAYKLAYNLPTDLLFQFDIKVCDMLERNVFGAKNTLKNGNATACPIEVGCYKQDNFVLDDSKFPPLIPPGNYRLDLTYFMGKKSVLEVQVTINVEYKLF